MLNLSSIKNVKGIKSLLSSCEIWNLKLDNNDEIILKIFPKYEEKNLIGFDKTLINRIQSLFYESLIYEKLRKINSNFFANSNFCEECSFDDLLNILNNCDNTKNLNNKENLIRNLNEIIYTDKIKSKFNYIPIEENKEDLYNNKKCLELKYSYLVLEKSKGIQIFDWLKKNNNINIWNLFFQICLSIYELNSLKINHNDLHFGNIFIEDLKEPEIIEIKVENNFYKFEIKNKIKIIDFDRSYCEDLGENKILNEEYTYRSNNFFSIIDILSILFYYGNFLVVEKGKESYIFNDYKEKVLNLILKKDFQEKNDKYIKETFEKMFYQKGGLYVEKESNIHLEIEKVYDLNYYCNTIDYILKEIYFWI